jgi:hypothetical protein
MSDAVKDPSSEQVTTIWDGVRAATAPSASSLVARWIGGATVAVLLATGGGAVGYAAIKHSADVESVAQLHGVSVAEADRRVRLQPQLEQLAQAAELAAGDRFVSARIDTSPESFGLLVHATAGVPIDALDQLAANNEPLVSVIYEGEVSMGELRAILVESSGEWTQEHPEIQGISIDGGAIRIDVYADPARDRKLLEYLQNHGADEASLRIRHLTEELSDK